MWYKNKFDVIKDFINGSDQKIFEVLKLFALFFGGARVVILPGFCNNPRQ